MSLIGALRLLTGQWESVRPALPDEAGDELDTLVERFADEGDEAERQAIGHQIADLLRAALPTEHEIRKELRAGDRFSPSHDWMDLSEQLVLRLDPARPSAAAVAAAVEARLLDVRSLGPAELAEAGVDPDAPELIRFDTADGPRWPAFQFGHDLRPVPVVVEVNLILDAEDDPFGVAAWWLETDGGLGGAPADLIGRIPDERLVAAAGALRSEG